MIVFDIETGPLSDEDLAARVKPFEAREAPGEFDPSKVRYGNLKDEAKKKKKLEDAKAAHEKAVKDHTRAVEQAREEWWANVKGKAALQAVTGQVLAIGYKSTDKGNYVLDIDREAIVLDNFWDQVRRFAAQGDRLLVGHNIAGFDLPFLRQRSFIHGIEVPDGVFERGRYLNERLFKDTMLVWTQGKFGEFVGLDVLARALGLPGKMEGITGADFAELIATDMDKAKAYLKTDLDVVAAVAEKLGLA